VTFGGQPGARDEPSGGEVATVVTRDATASHGRSSSASLASSDSATGKDKRIKLGALGLVVNAIVEHALHGRGLDATFAASSAEVLPQDVERLSPLGLDHINVVGRYHFGLPDDVAPRRRFRLFRDPNDLDF
jgi:hypothetical protein